MTRPVQPARQAAKPLQLSGANLDAFFPEDGWTGAATEGVFRAPHFAAARAPVARLAAPVAAAIAAGLAGPGPDAAARAAARQVMAQLHVMRVGGAPGLPDPGPARLGLPAGAAVLVLDPGD